VSNWGVKGVFASFLGVPVPNGSVCTSQPEHSQLDEKPSLEKELLQSAAAGDREAFRLLVEKHHSLVAATVIGMLGHGPESEDIGQEAFLRMHAALKGFRGEASIGTYLTRIAMNLCLNEIRRRKRRARFDFRFSKSEPPRTSDGRTEIESMSFQDSIRRAILRLEPEQRSTVVLCWMDGHTARDAADILGIPIGTVLSRLHRARKNLRQWLAPEMEDKHHG
jgi:RNA polymerase sigma-70 factor, ECF subfamily